MAHAKIISTAFGVTVAVVNSGSSAFEQNNILFNTSYDDNPYVGSVLPLPPGDITAEDIYYACDKMRINNSDNMDNVNIYQQSLGGAKTLIRKDSLIVPHPSTTQVIFFEDTNIHEPIRLGALISGGPDGIVAINLMKEAGSLENQAISGYDFFYIRAGRPSDWQEYNAIEAFLYQNFASDMFNLHAIDISTLGKRLCACGDDEVTYNRFGLSAALSLIAAECDTLKDRPDALLLGIHGADARFKARKSNEYTRHFIHSWNKFWKSFYPLTPLCIAPFIDVFDKIDVLKMAQLFNIKIENTWSCYKGGDNHCGECKSCLERRLAHKIAEMSDPTQYENTPEISQLKDHLGLVSFNQDDYWNQQQLA